MSAPAPDRTRLMRACHAACRDLGLDDATRHDVQLATTGKASMRDMDAGDLKRLLARLDSCTGHQRKQGRRRKQRHPKAGRGDLRLIHALWGELGRRGALRHPGRAGLNRFIRARFDRTWGYSPMDVDALTDSTEITDVIRALKDMLDRTDGPDDGDGPKRAA